jgi:hypothetical protein
MNDLFAEYATNYTAVPAPDKDQSCSTAAKTSSLLGNILSLAGVVGMFVPEAGAAEEGASFFGKMFASKIFKSVGIALGRNKCRSRSK